MDFGIEKVEGKEEEMKQVGEFCDSKLQSWGVPCCGV